MFFSVRVLRSFGASGLCVAASAINIWPPCGHEEFTFVVYLNPSIRIAA